MLLCSEIASVLAELHSCSEADGSARVTTHCLYPSFEAVNVTVTKFGHGFHVHDDGGAYREAWLHGRDEGVINRSINREAGRYQVKARNGAIFADTDSIDWLPSIILAVANASASAATLAVDKPSAFTDRDLKAEIFNSLERSLPNYNVKKGFHTKGKSGKEYEFDFGVFGTSSTILLVNAVIPHPNSIASKYLAFSDASDPLPGEDAFKQGGFRFQKFAVFDRPLAYDDSALMRQVADLVPISSLGMGAQRALRH